MQILTLIIIRLIDLYTLAILLRVLGSWVLASQVRLPTWAYNLLHALDVITAPVLNPIRRFIPVVAGMDVSPIVAVFLLQILERILLSLLW
jgi:YggT family protein